MEYLFNRHMKDEEFKLRPSMSSNSSIFANRGDPWVSPREGLEKFGRNVSSENPDMDMLMATKVTRTNPFFQLAGVDITPASPDKEVDPAHLNHKKRVECAMRLKRGLRAMRIREIKKEGADKA